MMHTPIGFYLFLGATFSWVGLLMFLGLRRCARSRAAAERDLSHLAAVEAFLAQLLAQAGELGLPIEIERDASEFQGLVADVLHGGAPFTVEEMQDLSDSCMTGRWRCPIRRRTVSAWIWCRPMPLSRQPAHMMPPGSPSTLT